MKTRIATWLRSLADWFDPPAVVDATVLMIPHDELYKDALDHVKWAHDSFSDEHHEAKRHAVFARLLDSHQTRSRRDIARAIEAALESV